MYNKIKGSSIICFLRLFPKLEKNASLLLESYLNECSKALAKKLHFFKSSIIMVKNSYSLFILLLCKSGVGKNLLKFTEKISAITYFLGKF